MFSLAPAPTPLDLNFRLLGMPVRIHPLFWLIAAILGWDGGESPQRTLIWVGCVFISVLVHEFGHGLVARRYGASPELLLYSMGGLCVYHERQSPKQRLVVLFWGPGAGFVLCGLTLFAAQALYGMNWRDGTALLGAFVGLPIRPGGDGIMRLIRGYMLNDPRAVIILNLVQINFLWGLLNLLPIWPLDGGQITGEGLTLLGVRHAMRRTHIISLLAAGVMAFYVYGRTEGQEIYLTLFFAFFAFNNFMMLQAIHSQYAHQGEDEDWWRR